MAKGCLPHMKRTSMTDGAVIVNITATLQDTATPFQLHAASAKAGIDVVTDILAVEWAEVRTSRRGGGRRHSRSAWQYGVRVVGLAPGGIAGTVGGPGGRVFGSDENRTSATAQVGSAIPSAENPEALRDIGVPAGRWGRVEDVALSALFLCSPAAPWITGTRLVVDGGSRHDRARGFPKMKDAVMQKQEAQKKRFGSKAKSKL